MRPMVVVAVSRLVPERHLTRILPMFALMTVLITSIAASEPVAAQEANRTAHAAKVCREWDETGSLLDPAWRRVVFKEGVRNAALPPLILHDVRHTAATMVLTQGVHPKVVSEMLGHATIRLTLNPWSHLVPVLRVQAADAMDVLLGPRLRKPQRFWGWLLE
jgi:hypothetical protein